MTWAGLTEMCVCVFLMTNRFEEEEEEEEEQGSFSALDHIRHFSEMRKMDDREFSDSDVAGFGSGRLSEAVKQPLYRKSKSQVMPCWIMGTVEDTSCSSYI